MIRLRIGDASHLDFRTPRYCVLMVRPSESLLHFIQKRQYRSAQRCRIIGLKLNKGGYHGSTTGR